MSVFFGITICEFVTLIVMIIQQREKTPYNVNI
jgi:hypothetical protein